MKMCIFNESKKCDNCGECDRCDLDPKKICDNCGKCLEMEGYDSKAIFIDKVAEDKEKSKKLISELDEEADKNTADKDDETDSHEILDDYDDDYVGSEDEKLPDDKFELIDDIDGLSEMLEDETKRNNLIEEKSPGFFVINKKNKEDK
ncbi:MAG: hypothetical protein PHX70_13295 [Clostridium sp.]|nr:hypothetical protein [Clostridium sp.]